jgi:hypothetical protein
MTAFTEWIAWVLLCCGIWAGLGWIVGRRIEGA